MGALTPVLYAIHIGGGAIGILSGMTALFVRKGSSLHMRVGAVFFYSMMGMTLSAAVLAGFVQHSRINTAIALFTLYLVATAWWTARNRRGESGTFELVALLGIAVLVGAFVLFSIQVTRTETGYFADDGILAPAYYVYTAMAILAAGLDLRVVYRKGVQGARRLARFSVSR